MTEPLFGELAQEYVAECLPLAEDVLERAIALERAWAGGEEALDLQGPLKGLLHTVKGNSAMMGFTGPQGVAHVLEDLSALLGTAPARRAAGAALLVQGAGHLSDLVRSAVPGGAAPEGTAELVERIRAFLAAASELPAELPMAERREGDRRATRAPGEVNAEGVVTTIRVDSTRLDALLETFGESMIAQAGLRDAVRRLLSHRRPGPEEAAVEHAVLALDRTLRSLERALMATRLLPISTVFTRFNRLVRDLARSESRAVRLEVAGGETRLDKTVIDRLGEPLVHLVSNAIVHGIEPAEERAARGKPAEAVITLAAAQCSDQVVLTVSDDGRGLDPDRILLKARSMGVVSEGETPALEDIFAFAFLPGLSTAGKLTSLAGRGVGLDVVANSIRALGGQVAVTSEPGRGTTFTLRLPLTLAVLRSLLVEVDGERYALPLADVSETLRVEPTEFHAVGGQQMLPWRDLVIPVFDGGALLGAGPATGERRYCVILQSGARYRGVLVDALLGHQEVVVKALDPALGRPPAVAGTTILGDGRVACILDTGRIAGIHPEVVATGSGGTSWA